MKKFLVDWLNIGLIIISLVIAIFLPFRLFIYAYAILGPLHYLTEINWLRDKKYFVNNGHWVWVAIGLTILIVFPKYFTQALFSGAMEVATVKSLINWLLDYANGFIFLWLLLSAALVFTKKWQGFTIAAILGIILAGLLNKVPLYISIIGLLVPTLIHVYLFTVLFMLYGAVKSKSWPGFVSVGMVLLVPVIIVLMPISPGDYFFSDIIKNTFTGIYFHVTNTKIANFLGLGGGDTFFFYHTMELKLQIFIAFAYTYHYLNWFSKTTVIKWHENISIYRSVIIGIIWAASAGLFWYDYTMGFWVLFSLSMLHVLLEFPLNVISVKGIVSALIPRNQ